MIEVTVIRLIWITLGLCLFGLAIRHPTTLALLVPVSVLVWGLRLTRRPR